MRKADLVKTRSNLYQSTGSRTRTPMIKDGGGGGEGKNEFGLPHPLMIGPWDEFPENGC